MNVWIFKAARANPGASLSLQSPLHPHPPNFTRFTGSQRTEVRHQENHRSELPSLAFLMGSQRWAVLTRSPSWKELGERPVPLVLWQGRGHGRRNQACYEKRKPQGCLPVPMWPWNCTQEGNAGFLAYLFLQGGLDLSTLSGP